MGKASKIRKRRKIETSNNGRGFLSVEDDASGADSGGSDSDDESVNSLIPSAISVLQYLSRRVDKYDEKAFKVFRVSVFPLLELQKTKFFEEPMVQPALTNEDFDRVVTTKALSAAISVARYFAINLDLFNDEDAKPFRRALHPLVVHTFKIRTVGSKAKAASLRQGDQNATTVALGVSTISNRISNCFRNKDYMGALNYLFQVASAADGDEAAVPKLGSLQRWVRDCDLTNPTPDENPVVTSLVSAKLDAAGVKEMSLLLLHAVLRVTNLVKKKHSASQTNTPGNQPAKLHIDHSGSIDYPYTRAVKLLYPPFSISKPWSADCYLELDNLRALIAAAAADYQVHADRIIGSGRSNVIDETLLREYTTKSSPTPEEFYQRVRVVSHVPGHLRRPPAPHDLNIFVTSTNTIDYASTPQEKSDSEKPTRVKGVAASVPLPVRHDIPAVPGAMLLTGVLTPVECAQFIVAAERLGYTPDAVDGIDNVVWLADESLLGPIYARVQSLLPPVLEGHELRGINARLRLFRYYPGAEYRPHIDGAWPGSGLLPDGSYTDDAFSADRHSRLTFLIYLNDGFTGGATTFFLPGPDAPSGSSPAEDDAAAHADLSLAKEKGVGYIEVRKVEPQLGAVLVFPHGSASGSLVHEGSSVTEGVKYVIRTDVLYTSKPVVAVESAV
eukprot:CAMPEP_0184968578 /NCGR_PEP_ID=MMETSP1098-20130426/1596_1 /TAXON_ID=89044 /ORGANISM="Spumella elongata, Strain CCAP 955/1" /LENGTH=671 /DNA_ID=CAMNT_0027490221 /DNA_START=24 /DNA_END=2039 /DNA_ORIENTATION=-